MMSAEPSSSIIVEEPPGGTTATETPSIASSSGAPDKLPVYSNAKEAKPPHCFRCNEKLEDDGIRLDDKNVYCKKCVKYFANEGLKEWRKRHQK